MQKNTSTQHSNQQGQSMVEYALIVVLVILAFVLAIGATGPAIGNVFSNTVYNLLGTNPDEINDLPDKDAFWLTVTWVSQNEPLEVPLPTRTLPPPTEAPTSGPSPTPTATVPTNTPEPTNTPTPSPTPKDFEFVAPWHDSADEDEHWRLGGDVFLGADEGWWAEYFPDTALTSSSSEGYTSEIDIAKKYNLDFDWGNGSPISGWPSADPGNNFGISYRRQIYLENPLTLLFKLEGIDDGARIWLLDGHGDITTTRPSGCSATGTTWGGTPSGSGNPVVYDDLSAYPADCLLLDGWWNIAGKTATVKRTVPAGSYTVVVDMYDSTGNAKIKVNLEAVEFSGNPDNTAVDSSGNPTGNSADCRWGNVEDTRDSNSSDFRWDSWESSYAFGVGNRCYLELRGSVEIPAGMTDPILTFWDIWDFRQSGMEAWVEIADYDPDNDGIFDRNDLVWTTPKKLIHDGVSTNYNWTYQRIPLSDLLPAATTMVGRKYAIRFGMENPSVSYSTGTNIGYRLWWVDSINIDAAPQDTFYTAQMWDLDTPEQADNFITSGRWELSAAKTRGASGLAWDDSNFADYATTDLDGCGSACNYSDENLRMHTLEFDGIIDLDNPLGVTDLEGDGGDALLSFWHAYDIDRYTGLEIQYSTDLNYNVSGTTPVDWQLVPGGQINVRDSSSRPTQNSMTFEEINLEALKALEPGQNGKFRIRFALTVARWSDIDPGWWIDDIQLERDAVSRFLPYPYIETFLVEDTINDWLLGGDWARTDERAWRPVDPTEYSLTDSPLTTYAINQTSTAELRLALDVNNDSPFNPFSPACTLSPSTLCDEPDNVTPIDPILTFQWWHEFDDREYVYVEWKKAVDTDNVWRELWSYQDCGWYTNSSNCDSRRGMNWQRVEIDLRQIWASNNFDNNLPDATTDDDILFRFRFVSDSSNGNAEGVYIDEIHIEERDETSIALWDAGVAQDVDTPSFPTTAPLIYTTGSYRYIRMVGESAINGQDYGGGAEFNLLDKDGNDIDRAAWTVDYVDSEQASNYLIGKMLDGDTNTFWHTQWTPTRDAYSHEFQIDLGASYQVGFFKYLARQDHSNTRFAKYKFYLSTDGSTWELAGQGTLANTTSEQTISLQVDYTTNTPPAASGVTSTVIGSGVSYRDNLDDRANELFDNWYIGGTWDVVEWEQYDGVLAFHSSTAVPLNSGGTPETPPPNPTVYTLNSGRTYNVLEMSTIIDLRATQVDRKPIMTFWQRHHIGRDSDARVQISYEDPSTIGTSTYCRSSSRDQCYEHYYGWSTWETAPPWNLSGYNDWNLSGERRQYLWKREIVDLSSYAATASNPGKRIRIRFVSDSLDNSVGDGNLRDGWFIDNVEFKYNIPSVVNIDVDTGDSFFDAARNTRNWLTEGTWGLSPEFFRGSGGGPADFGGAFWTYWIYNMAKSPACNTGNTGFRNCVNSYFNSMPNPDTDPQGKLVKKGLALDVNNDWGSGGPAGLSYMFAGIWEITTPVIGTTMNAGNYTMVFTYDEGLRVKFDTVPAGSLPSTSDLPDPYDPEWNIYNDFNTGGRQIGVGNALFETGKQYKIRMEYFDRWGDAALILSLGSSSFSFTDSPKQASGPSFLEIPAAPRSQSSMIFNGVFDLKDAVAPVLQYYTFHELGGAGRVEVTTDGGFLWTQSGLIGTEPAGLWTSDWSGDFWNDEARLNNEKMAYDISSGSIEWDTTLYPPEQSIASFATDMNFNWGSNSPVAGWTRPGGGNVVDDWSAQFRRSFTLAIATDMTFNVRSDDGHRLWLNLNGTGYFPQCYFLDGTKPLASGQPRVSGENDEVISGTGTECLLISDWEDGGNNFKSVTRRIPAGNHELILDYYENGGGSKLILDTLAGDFDNPNNYGTWMPDNGTWRERIHSFEAYAGYEADGDPKPPIGLRFRLDRLGESETGNYQQARTQSPTNWMESWWITDITVVDTVAGPQLTNRY